MKRLLLSEKGFSSRTLIAVIAALAIGFGGGYAFFGRFHDHAGEERAGAEEELYTCGMHPWIITNKPGDCPICGMKLTRIEGDQAKAAAKSAQPAQKPKDDDFFSDLGGAKKKGKILFYRNPMNPAITSKVPAKDEMGMDYVPVYEEELASGGDTGDRAEVRLSDDAIVRAGVRTAIAQTGTLARSARAVGRVVPDETAVKIVNVKAGGWIEKLHVNYTGQFVEKGQPLVTLYSPELLATQEEYLRARAAAKNLSASSDSTAREQAGELAALAARRLELFDVPSSAVDELEKTGKASRSVTLRAPLTGFVTGKEVFEGSRIEPGMALFTVADLSRIWVETDVYEYEADGVAVGGNATIATPNSPGAGRTGKITFVSPVVDSETRTIKARLEFANPGLKLKPGMFVDVNLPLAESAGVLVPDSAVMDTGERKIVYVEREKGVFEPRSASIAVRAKGMALLTSGVKPGEAVVVKANFLLDSESKLRATITRMRGESSK